MDPFMTSSCWSMTASSMLLDCKITSVTKDTRKKSLKDSFYFIFDDLIGIMSCWIVWERVIKLSTNHVWIGDRYLWNCPSIAAWYRPISNNKSIYEERHTICDMKTYYSIILTRCAFCIKEFHNWKMRWLLKFQHVLFSWMTIPL